MRIFISGLYTLCQRCPVYEHDYVQHSFAISTYDRCSGLAGVTTAETKLLRSFATAISTVVAD